MLFTKMEKTGGCIGEEVSMQIFNFGYVGFEMPIGYMLSKQLI